ncbi:MAG: 30S ribosome-binding factor RbfA [Kiritimatiellia bacterium]|nr:30S ribosome-binding factor RbfA [Kiritimatiellia bacterium]MDP6810141.1 30S ribosome-binding factor RbfA [Kiritimatiellia bacterium]MDP7023641.1 30S ribosome-binding factor RbfA [Kiritimatiellia bacterium]
MTRVNELLKREISTALFRMLAPEERVDTAAVTVTHVITSRNLRHARVLISILGHEDERGTIMSQIRDHRVEIQQWINRNMKLKYTPKLDFELDTSVEQGDHVLGILQEMEDERSIPPYYPEEADASESDEAPPYE